MKLKDKVKIYEDFFHKINMAVTMCNDTEIWRLINLADNWSYSHRVGNGSYSEYKQQKMIDEATELLR